MTHRSIQGIDGEENESPRARAWGRYLEHQDAMAGADAAEEAEKARSLEEGAAQEVARIEARRAQAMAEAARLQGAPDPAPRADRGGNASAITAAAAAFGKAVKQALTETPEQKRMDLFSAMQAEVLARLELAPQAEGAALAQAEALGGGFVAQQTDRALGADRAEHEERVDGDQKVVRADPAKLEQRPVQDKVVRPSGPAKSAPSGTYKAPAKPGSGTFKAGSAPAKPASSGAPPKVEGGKPGSGTFKKADGGPSSKT